MIISYNHGMLIIWVLPYLHVPRGAIPTIAQIYGQLPRVLSRRS